MATNPQFHLRILNITIQPPQAGLLLIAKTSMSSMRHCLTTSTAKVTLAEALIRVLFGVQTTAASSTQGLRRRFGRPLILVLSDKSAEHPLSRISVRDITLSKIGVKTRLVDVSPMTMRLGIITS